MQPPLSIFWFQNCHIAHINCITWKVSLKWYFFWNYSDVFTGWAIRTRKLQTTSWTCGETFSRQRNVWSYWSGRDCRKCRFQLNVFDKFGLSWKLDFLVFTANFCDFVVIEIVYFMDFVSLILNVFVDWNVDTEYEWIRETSTSSEGSFCEIYGIREL